MNNYCKLLVVTLSTAVLFSCSSSNSAKEKFSGKWYFVDAPQSYIEFSGSTYTEHLGEINSTIVYDIEWTDSLHYELEVKKVDGAAGAMFTPGDKLEVEVKEITPAYFRFFEQGRCIFVTRQKNYTGPIGTPC